MAGGTKPAPHTRKAEKFQDWAKKSGGIGTTKHAGPKRASKTPPRGTKGSQVQRRLQPQRCGTRYYRQPGHVLRLECDYTFSQRPHAHIKLARVLAVWSRHNFFV